MKYEDKIFQQFIFLINLLSVLVFIIVLGGLAYVPLEKTIKEYIDKPRYSKEELSERLKQREYAIAREKLNDPDLIEAGIHVQTGLIYDKNLHYIKKHCISCHSPKLIAQNKSTRSGWKQMIVWMQETQGLHDLAEDEVFVLDYLAEHYAPKKLGRRANLDIESIEWYVLELDD